MLLTDLCIELRPNLRCGNAYLQFNGQLSDNGRKTRIILKEHNVHIMGDDDGNNLIIRYNCFGMDIHGISIFTVNGNHMSFRFNYTKIDMDALEQNTVQVDMQPLVMTCRENEEFSLICHNCDNELVESTIYKRLREFPSCIVDPSDFFCHNHGSAAEAHQDLLVPPERNLFYGLNFIVINIYKIKGVMNRGGQLYCQRCLAIVGNTVLNDKAAKLWADAVRYLPKSLEIAQKRHLFQYSSVTQLMKRLLHILWPQPLSPLCPTKNRALLITTLPNRQQQSILMHIVDSQLRVLRRVQPNIPDLQCFYACKLYFGIYGRDQQIPATVPAKPWESEESLPQMEISPRMFQELQNQLTTNSQLIPYAWRFNTAEEKLVLSYFFYQNDYGTEDGNKLLEYKKKLQEQQKQQQKEKQKTSLHVEYETDAGHASQESDDEHSDSDNGHHYSVAAAAAPVSVPIKMLPQTIARRPPSPSVSDSN